MSNDSFDEAENFLVQNWAAARQLEVSMGKVRDKYTAIAQRVVEAVRGRQEGLDAWNVKVTQHWDSGFIGVGRKLWRVEEESPSGFYIENIRLEVLSDESKSPPEANIWLKPAIKRCVDAASVTQAIHRVAAKLLSKEEKARCRFVDDGEYSLKCTLPQSRKELLEMLCQGDSQAFVDCLCSHFELLGRFSPVLDEVLSKSAK